MVELPDWMERHILLMTAKEAHGWAAERMRAKLLSDPDFVAAEAERLILRDFGPIPPMGSDARMDEEDEELDWRQRQQALEIARDMLEHTESYMWGLGIAGLFHQWERGTKGVIMQLSVPPPVSLEQKRFDTICDLLEKLGFDIRRCTAFSALDTARLISNTIKHGEGRDFSALKAKHPELIPDFGLLNGRFTIRADDFRFTVHEFDAATAGIGQIWNAFENAPPSIHSRLRSQ
jgi:hypothetical protein